MRKQVINFLRKLVTKYDRASRVPQLWAVKAPKLTLKFFSFTLSLSNIPTYAHNRQHSGTESARGSGLLAGRTWAKADARF